MKNRMLLRVLRALIVLLGAGVGILLGELMLPLMSAYLPALASVPRFRFIAPAMLAVIFGLFFFAFSYRMAAWIMKEMGKLASSLDEMSTREIFMAGFGLLLGLAVAALASNLVLAAGISLFTLTLCAILYVACGWMGIYISRKRAAHRRRRKSRLAGIGLDMLEDDADGEEENAVSEEKLLDSSALIDGRLEAVRAAGFLEGNLLCPVFVADELRRLADSAEEERRASGKRGLNTLSALTEKNLAALLDADYDDLTDVDAKLLRLCADRGAALITGDANLIREAAAARIVTLSLPALAEAMRPPVSVGMRLSVTIRKVGREPGQGVGFLEDGTMVVCENAAARVNETLNMTVTSLRTTSAGRMIFCREAE